MSDSRAVRLCGLATALLLTACEREAPQTETDGAAAAPSAERADVSGERVYQNNCLLCHMEDGSGTPRLYPPLVDSAVVEGDVDPLVRMTLLGVGVGADSLEPSGEWDGVMTGFSHLSDEEIAAVLTYIRHSWGNEASAISAEEVAETREAISG